MDVQIAETWIRPAGLNISRSGLRNVDRLGLLLVRTFGAHVIDLEAGPSHELLLKSEIPPLIETHVGFEGQRCPADGSKGCAERHAEKVITRRAGWHDVGRGSDRLAEAERQEVEIQTAARPFGFVEDTVAAANDGAIAQRPPCKPRARRDLFRVVLGDVERNARL